MTTTPSGLRRAFKAHLSASQSERTKSLGKDRGFVILVGTLTIQRPPLRRPVTKATLRTELLDRSSHRRHRERSRCRSALR